jgi:hypothetical protein
VAKATDEGGAFRFEPERVERGELPHVAAQREERFRADALNLLTMIERHLDTATDELRQIREELRRKR